MSCLKLRGVAVRNVLRDLFEKAGCAALLTSVSLLAGCAHLVEPWPNETKESLVAVTKDGHLIRVHTTNPWEVRAALPLRGLPVGEQLVGMDFRVAKGVLYALGRTGQLYTLDVQTAQLAPVGNGRLQVPLRGTQFGVDFNPTVDRIRVVSELGQNLRLHPDTGAMVDFDAAAEGVQPDPDLRFADPDPQTGQRPQVAATAYTYNLKNEKLTTNFVIDSRLGTLVLQGSREGVEPVESPNLGVLRTVGELGTGPLLDAAFDIADVGNTPLLAVRTATDVRTRLYRVDLTSGKATLLGTLGSGQVIIGMAIEP